VSKREDEKLEAWKADFRNMLPEEKREAFDAIADLDVVRDELFRGTIRQKDYYTRLNEFNEEKSEFEQEKQKVEAFRDQLYQWYDEEGPKNETLIQERDMLRAQLEELGTDNPPSAGSPISTEELAALKAKVDNADKLDKILPTVLSDQMAIAIDAVKNGFDIDPREVMKISLQHNVTPYKAYEHLTAAQRSQRYEKAREEEREKWKEEGRREATSASNGSPDHISQTGPSVVDYLQRPEQEDTDHNTRVAAALQRLENKDY
jgi:hypothetical protein